MPTLLLEQQANSTIPEKRHGFVDMDFSASDLMPIGGSCFYYSFSAQPAVTKYDFVAQVGCADFFSASQARERHVMLKTLLNFNYKLKKPIDVVITRHLDGTLVGEIEEFELYSFGDCEFEILRELNEDLTGLLEDLLAIGDSKLGKTPARWKAVLKEYIGETRGD